jgi:hypothetical protein
VSAEEKARSALGAWRRYALKHGAQKAQTFQHEALQRDIADVNRRRLAAALDAEEVKAAFVGPFLKTVANESEGTLSKRLTRTYREFWMDIVEDIVKGKVPNLNPLSAGIRAALITVLTTTIADRLTEMAGVSRVQLEPERVITDAGAWAAVHAGEQIKKIEATQLARVQQVSQQLADGLITREDAVALLEPMFGAVRAEMIATTEVTTAMSQATAMYKEELDKRGQLTVERWLTAEDERVCEVCGPLDHTLREEWGQQFPGGPPAHVNCRCQVALERAS